MFITKQKYNEMLSEIEILKNQIKADVVKFERDKMQLEERYLWAKRQIGSLHAIIAELRKKLKIKNGEFNQIVAKHMTDYNDISHKYKVSDALESKGGER